MAQACQSSQLLQLGGAAKHKYTTARMTSLGQFRHLWKATAFWLGILPRSIFKLKSKWQRANFLGHVPPCCKTALGWRLCCLSWYLGGPETLSLQTTSFDAANQTGSNVGKQSLKVKAFALQTTHPRSNSSSECVPWASPGVFSEQSQRTEQSFICCDPNPYPFPTRCKKVSGILNYWN